MATEQLGLKRRSAVMAVLMVVRTTDAAVLLISMTLPLFALFYALLSATVAGFATVALLGLSVDIGAEVARAGLLSPVEEERERNRSLLAFAGYVNLSLALGTVAGVVLAPVSLSGAVVAAAIAPAIDRALLQWRWWASPSSLVVELGSRAVGKRGALAEAFQSPLIARLDFQSLLRPPGLS